jgi:hypothetical protein
VNELAISRVRVTLDETAYRSALEEGRALSLDAAIALAEAEFPDALRAGS